MKLHKRYVFSQIAKLINFSCSLIIFYLRNPWASPRANSNITKSRNDARKIVGLFSSPPFHMSYLPSKGFEYHNKTITQQPRMRPNEEIE